jgi:hypothetical protein
LGATLAAGGDREFSRIKGPALADWPDGKI